VTLPTKLPHEELADALLAAGLAEMSLAARRCRYHVFRSPLDDPGMTLARELHMALKGARSPDQAQMIGGILAAHLDGHWDATPEESDRWTESDEGRDAMLRLVEGC
jgi:hypothetical protein